MSVTTSSVAYCRLKRFQTSEKFSTVFMQFSWLQMRFSLAKTIKRIVVFVQPTTRCGSVFFSIGPQRFIQILGAVEQYFIYIYIFTSTS